MSYESEEIRQSQEIFYYLLEHHELQEEEEPPLYRAYAEQESVQNLVKSQGEIALCNIERYGNVIYLIPKEENHFLGFSKPQLKSILCKSTGTDKDYYLSQFVVLTLLVEFFDGQGISDLLHTQSGVVESRPRERQQFRSGLGESHLMAHALEKRCVKFLLELLDLL